MNTATFDTLAAAEKMAEAGIPPEHAKSIASAIGQRGVDYATKEHLDAAIANLKATMAGWLLTLAGMMLAGFAVVVTILLRILGG